MVWAVLRKTQHGNVRTQVKSAVNVATLAPYSHCTTVTLPELYIDRYCSSQTAGVWELKFCQISTFVCLYMQPRIYFIFFQGQFWV